MKKGHLLLLSLVAFLVLSCNLAPDAEAPESPSRAGPGIEIMAAAGSGSSVMLQGFHWGSGSGWYTTIANNAAAIQAAGFNMVWFPPSSKTADAHGYLPTEWYNLSSPYGTQSALQSTITTLKGKGVYPIADIVINHRCGTANWADFSNPAFANNAAAVCYNDEWGQGTGAADTGMGYDGGRDLDHKNASVQTEIKNWMNWLKNTIGFSGWRYDFVKGYSGSYNSVYNTATTPAFSVGEYWADITGDYYASGSGVDYHRQVIQNWVNASGSAAFDFTTKWQLMLAVSRTEFWRLKDAAGKPIGLIGWSPGKSVTFLDNHDTGPSPYGQDHWVFPSAGVELGYAYILTHPGIPCVFWPHYFNYGSDMQNKIKTLMAIRASQGITSTSSVSILIAEATRYAAKINNNTIVKIGPGAYDPGTGWTMAASGNNWAVWKAGSTGGGTVTTTIKIAYDVGYGNNMYIRGDSPLSWTAGTLMTWTTGNVWTWTTTAIPQGAVVEYKALINNTTWSDGANYLVTGGQTVTINPTFTGNFYDTMDSLHNWSVTGGTSTYKWGTYNYMARARGCSTESQLTLKPSLSKLGTVTLAFKRQVSGLDAGEYLAVDVYYNGAWKQIASFTGTLALANVS